MRAAAASSAASDDKHRPAMSPRLPPCNVLPLDLFNPEVPPGTDAVGMRAQSKFISPDGHVRWTPCRVTGFDVETSMYAIKWIDCPGGKHVTRFNLRLEGEEMGGPQEIRWESNRREALEARHATEAEISRFVRIGASVTTSAAPEEASATPASSGPVDGGPFVLSRQRLQAATARFVGQPQVFELNFEQAKSLFGIVQADIAEKHRLVAAGLEEDHDEFHENAVEGSAPSDEQLLLAPGGSSEAIEVDSRLLHRTMHEATVAELRQLQARRVGSSMKDTACLLLVGNRRLLTLLQRVHHLCEARTCTPLVAPLPGRGAAIQLDEFLRINCTVLKGARIELCETWREDLCEILERGLKIRPTASNDDEDWPAGNQDGIQAARAQTFSVTSYGNDAKLLASPRGAHAARRPKDTSTSSQTLDLILDDIDAFEADHDGPTVVEVEPSRQQANDQVGRVLSLVRCRMQAALLQSCL